MPSSGHLQRVAYTDLTLGLRALLGAQHNPQEAQNAEAQIFEGASCYPTVHQIHVRPNSLAHALSEVEFGESQHPGGVIFIALFRCFPTADGIQDH